MNVASLPKAVQLLRAAATAGAEELKGPAGLLEQLQGFSDEELGRFGQRIPHLRAVLRSNVPPVGELVRFLVPPFVGLPKPERVEQLGDNWVSDLLQAELEVWKNLNVEISPALRDLFIETLEARGKQRVELDRACGLAYCLLPDLALTPKWYQDHKLIAPRREYWDWLKAGKLLLPDGAPVIESCLIAGVYLADTRCKPRYNDGRQRWADDQHFMECLIGVLQDRGELLVNKTGGRGSRFYLSRLDYEQMIAPLYAQALDLPEGSRVRLETALEWSTLCQSRDWPRAKDGTTNTWCWFHEFFASSDDSLTGGRSDSGGLSHVSCFASGSRWAYFSGRLLAVLGMLGSGS